MELHNQASSPRIINFNRGKRINLAPGESKPITPDQLAEARGNVAVQGFFAAGDLRVLGEKGGHDVTTVEPAGAGEGGAVPSLESITTEKIATLLRDAGFVDVAQVAAAELDALTAINGIGDSTAQKLKDDAAAALPGD